MWVGELSTCARWRKVEVRARIVACVLLLTRQLNCASPKSSNLRFHKERWVIFVYRRTIFSCRVSNDASIELKRIVDIIVSSVSPDKIILFGSRARGDNRVDSDIDLLVLKRNIINEREVTRKAYQRMFSEDISIPIDLLAADLEKYDELKRKNGMIYKTIESEGVVVYG